MPGVYSERFLSFASSTGDTSRSFSVPVAKRLVVKSVTAYNGATTVGAVGLSVAGKQIWFASVPAGGGASAGDMMVVAYAGESISLNCYVGMQVQCSGYLLDT